VAAHHPDHGGGDSQEHDVERRRRGVRHLVRYQAPVQVLGEVPRIAKRDVRVIDEAVPNKQEDQRGRQTGARDERELESPRRHRRE
jgi:hypothetical protein